VHHLGLSLAQAQTEIPSSRTEAPGGLRRRTSTAREYLTRRLEPSWARVACRWRRTCGVKLQSPIRGMR